MEKALEALSQGATITIVGMFVVFFFLTIMIFAMQIATKIVEYLNKKYPPEVKETTPARKKVNTDEQEAIAIAIAAAVNAGAR